LVGTGHKVPKTAAACVNAIYLALKYGAISILLHERLPSSEARGIHTRSYTT